MQPVESSWEEIKLLTDTYTKFWNMYISWFTWFFGINVAAMSFLVTKNNPTTDKHLLWALCIFMSVCVFFGVVASFKMIEYGRKASLRGEALKEQIQKENFYVADTKILMGDTIASPTSWLILGSVIWIFCGWLFMVAWAADLLPHATH